MCTTSPSTSPPTAATTTSTISNTTENNAYLHRQYEALLHRINYRDTLAWNVPALTVAAEAALASYCKEHRPRSDTSIRM